MSGFARNQDLLNTESNVGSDADVSSSSGSVHGKLKDVKTTVAAIPTTSIKSIQRGVASPTTATSLSITISSVDPTKSTVRLNGQWGSDSNGNSGVPFVVSLTSTTLTIGQYGAVSSTTNGKFSWEVKENI